MVYLHYLFVMTDKEIRAFISKFYTPGTELFNALWLHSQSVRAKAMKCLEKRAPQLNRDLVSTACMLHDIGIINCHAPNIHCHGWRPYICHGQEGAIILRNEGMEALARIAERHTGSGLSTTEIILQDLPLPHKDFIPETPEEMLVCYADKFFSKSGKLTEEKPLSMVIAGIKAFGNESLQRFMSMHNMFCI